MRLGIRSRRLVACAVAIVVFGAARAAAAQDRDARALEAKKACLGGHADRGIELLAELYAETNDPTYIYNQGRCFEQNGRAAEAVTRFREYLRKAPNLATDEKAQLDARIAELEGQTRTAAPAPAPAPSPAAGSAGSPAAPPAPGVALAAPTPSSQSYRLAGVVVGGVGVLAIAGGVVMGLRARSLSNQVTNDAYTKGTFSQSDYDAGRLAERLEWVGYGVGAAALVTGGFLYYWGTRQAGREPAVAMTAYADPTGARALLRVSF